MASNDSVMPERPLAADPMAARDPNAGYQVVAMFETFERARTARDRLLEEGIAAADLDILNRDAEAGYSNFEYDRNDEGFWAAVKRFFVPEQDAYGYTEGLRRGQAMLVVRAPFARRERIEQILESCDPIDVETQEESWRQAGWTGAASVGMSATTPGTSDAARGRAATAAGEQAIPVVEESIRVGKRVVDRGGVRIRSYVMEEPFEQDVTLHDERVNVERRPADRPVGALPEDAFRERTIEVTATGEEPVVQKDARVTEEVVVSKEARERTETVRDKTRKTEVEVEDARTGKTGRPSKRPFQRDAASAMSITASSSRLSAIASPGVNSTNMHRADPPSARWRLSRRNTAPGAGCTEIALASALRSSVGVVWGMAASERLTNA